jgi:UDP-glucuronate 4-epimerase
MNFLVTGGAGFIGSHLCEALINEGNKVICLDNFDEFYPKNIKKDNIKDMKENPKFHLITGDVRDTDNLIDIMTSKKIEVVIHLAGKGGAINSLKNPTDYISFNINGTVSVLEAMKESEVTKLIFTSSSSVYGNSMEAPFKETFALSTPTSPYGATKQAAEMFIKMYHEMYGISAIVLRMFSVYGPRQRPDSGMYQFIKSNLKNQSIAIYGEGKIQRDYTYIDDMIQGIQKAIHYIKKNDDNMHQTINLGSSSPIGINDLFEIIEKETQKPTLRTYKKSPLGVLQATHADLSLANQYLEYKPNINLVEGVRRTIEWMKNSENL